MYYTILFGQRTSLNIQSVWLRWLRRAFSTRYYPIRWSFGHSRLMLYTNYRVAWARVHACCFTSRSSQVRFDWLRDDYVARPSASEHSSCHLVSELKEACLYWTKHQLGHLLAYSIRWRVSLHHCRQKQPFACLKQHPAQKVLQIAYRCGSFRLHWFRHHHVPKHYISVL